MAVASGALGQDEVADMLEKGAAGTDDEIRRVVAYLVKHFK